MGVYLQEQAFIATNNAVALVAHNIDTKELTYHQAITGPDSDKWKEAIAMELLALAANKTLFECILPAGRKAIKTKWVFAIKDDGRYKARLVVKGFTQLYGIDFDETFAPVGGMNTLRSLVACAVVLNWDIQAYDISNAFMHTDLDEEIYIELPQGWISEGGFKHGLLKKALNGLKQGSRLWNANLDANIRSLGYKQSKKDRCVYFKDESKVYIITDDILLFTEKDVWRVEFEEMLDKNYKHRKLGKPQRFNGFKFVFGLEGVMLIHDDYIEAKAKNFNVKKSLKLVPPITVSVDESLETEPRPTDSDISFRGLVGSLLYTTVAIRVDVAFAVHRIARFTHQAGSQHINAGTRVLQYLANTSKYGLLFKKGSIIIDGYVDASFQSPRSTTGYVVRINGTAVAWRSKKQSVTAQSTMEAEYIALSECAKEVMYLTDLLSEIGVYSGETVKIYEDNKACCLLSKNPEFRDKAKHIGVRYHLLQDLVAQKRIEIEWIGTKNQIADGLTKPMTMETLINLRSKVNLVEWKNT